MVLKLVMGFLVALIVLGVFYVAATVSPSISELVQAFTFRIPQVPAWAIEKAGVHPNPWREILPLLGRVAGGFGTQVHLLGHRGRVRHDRRTRLRAACGCRPTTLFGRVSRAHSGLKPFPHLRGGDHLPTSSTSSIKITASSQ
ncbi:MAG: hypothetical protein EHM61_16585 [Acidobacteria bacterium]|nr:MAG: hypothetical protein EHM61_16585 [Acidobacteriota bacterium]